MTLLFSAMAAIAVVATACDNSKEEWAAMADSCTYVLVENFLDKTQGTFWGENFTSGVASMGAQASGASLMEGVARMVAAEE